MIYFIVTLLIMIYLIVNLLIMIYFIVNLLTMIHFIINLFPCNIIVLSPDHFVLSMQRLEIIHLKFKNYK